MSNRTQAQLSSDVGEFIGLPSGARGNKIATQALNEAIDFVNTRNFYMLRAIANLTLVSGSRTYSLSTNWPNFKAHIATVLLNSAQTLRERYILYLTPEDFFRAGYETTNLTGSPFYLTVDILNDLIRINTDPGAGFNGRILRTLYYRKLSHLSTPLTTGTLGTSDELEDLVVQQAIWRGRRLARLDYLADQRNAEMTEKRLLANQESVDIASDGLL